MTTYNYAEVLHFGQAALSAYGLVSSLVSIKKLREWEPQTEKAAKVSNTAADQLHRTRTTQGSAFANIVASLGLSLTLATSWQKVPWPILLLISPAMAGVTKVVHAHVSNFWEKSQKIPMATGYNTAIRNTEEVMKVLQWLEWSWWVSALLAGAVQYR